LFLPFLFRFLVFRAHAFPAGIGAHAFNSATSELHSAG
jgi:hypothetical protein